MFFVVATGLSIDKLIAISEMPFDQKAGSAAIPCIAFMIVALVIWASSKK